MLFHPDGRPRYKSKKVWHLIDLSRFRTIVNRARQFGLDDCDHQGKTLWRNEHCVVAAVTDPCSTEDQARMLASNGMTWRELRRRQILGERRGSKYFDRRRYACVERRVFRDMCEQPVIEWNANIVRDRLFGRFGEAILSELCTSYLPPVMNPDEDMARTEVLHRLPPWTLDRRPHQILPDPPPKPPSKRVYVVVDLWEYNELRMRRNQELRPELLGLSDGQLFKRSACTKTFLAAAPLSAKEAYLRTVQRQAESLPEGRFLVLTKNLFDKAGEHSLLPLTITVERLKAVIRKRGLPLEDDPAYEVGDDPGGLVHDPPHAAAPDIRPTAVTAQREPGEDFEPGEIPMDLSDWTEEELMEFPPRIVQLALFAPSVLEAQRPRSYQGPLKPKPWRKAPPRQLRLKFKQPAKAPSRM